MATAESEAKKGRDRSPSFPIITLETALRRAQEFFDEEKRGSAPLQVVARHWHYSPSSSGALQTVAAMKQYGLMAEEGGSGKERKLRLTELALRIILDNRPDSPERAKFKAQAARTPTIVEEIYERWPEGLPSEQNLNHYLVLEREFNEPTAAKAVKILKENELFTGERANAMLSELQQMGTDSVSRLPVAGNQNTVIEVPVVSTRYGAVAPAVSAGQKEVASFPVAKNQVVRLITTEPLTKAAVEALVKQLELGLELGVFPEEKPA